MPLLLIRFIFENLYFGMRFLNFYAPPEPHTTPTVLPLTQVAMTGDWKFKAIIVNVMATLDSQWLWWYPYCPGVFSNTLSHAGVQEEFQIDCCIRVSRTILIDWCRQESRSIFKLTVTRGCPGVWLTLSTLLTLLTLLTPLNGLRGMRGIRGQLKGF